MNMTTKTLYPHTLSQTSENNSSYREFNNLSNVKNTNDTYAKTGQIASKSGTHKIPSAITATNFKANIPGGSKINSITVEYVADYEGNISIGKPTIDILNVTGDNKKGKSLTTTLTKSTAKWTGNHTIANVNSSSFGVKISFPANTKADTGYVKIKYIRIIIDYTLPNYSINLSKVNGDYTGDVFLVKANASNVNKTTGDTNVTIQLPTGVSYQGKDSGTGSLSVTGSKITWTPGLSNKVLNSNVVLKLLVSTNGNHNIIANENSSGHTHILNINTTERPSGGGTTGDDDPDDTPKDIDLNNIILNAKSEEEISFKADLTPIVNEITAHLTEGDLVTNIKYSLTVPSNCDLWIEEDGEFVEYDEATGDWVITNNIWTGKFRVDNYGLFQIPVGYSYTLTHNGTSSQITGSVGTFYLNIKPSSEEDLTIPSLTILQPTPEEQNRLGDGYSYTAQTYLEEVQPYTETSLFSDSTERSLSNSTSGVKTYAIPSSTLTNLPVQFELEFKFKGANNFTSRFMLCPTNEYTADTHPDYYMYGGKGNDNSMTAGVRTNGTTDYVTGASAGTGYNTFKIVRTDDTTFKFYANDTLLSVKTVDWFNDYSSYTLYLINWYNGATCSADDITLTTQVPIEAYVRDWYKNFRIGVFNNSIGTPTQYTIINEDGEEETIEYDSTNYDTLTPSQIFKNAEYWSNCPTAVNTYTNLECGFMYNKNYPLYILICGDYPEAENTADIKYTEPVIIESDTYNGYEKNGNYPVAIRNLINPLAEEASTLTLASFEESTHFIVYNPDVLEDYGTTPETAIRGIELTGDIEFSDDLVLSAILRIPHENTYLTGSRSIIINNEDTTLKIGGTYDTWGLDIGELINLDQLEFELGVNNILENDTSIIKISNLQIVFYTQTIEPSNIDVYVNDENVAWYGMNLTGLDIPTGRNTDTKYLQIDGTDTNIPYRQTIEGKTIKLKFSVNGCDITETTKQLEQINKLFTNKRDELNTPIPNTIRFSHLPGKEFYFLLEKTFDHDIVISDYDGSMDLYIPDGTAFDIEDTVTNVTGYVDSLAKVNPIITLTHLTGTQIIITETHTNQVFKINQNNLTDTTITFEVNDTIIINTINRTVNLIKENTTEPIDISEAVDYNSDWFKIQEDFEFTQENCTIQTVTYNNRS